MSYILQLQLQHARSLQPRSEAHVPSEYEEHRADAHEEPWELASQHGYGVASNIAGWWFGTLLILVNHKYMVNIWKYMVNIWTFLNFYILGIIIPTDFHIFQRGWYNTNQIVI